MEAIQRIGEEESYKRCHQGDSPNHHGVIEYGKTYSQIVTESFSKNITRSANDFKGVIEAKKKYKYKDNIKEEAINELSSKFRDMELKHRRNMKAISREYELPEGLFDVNTPLVRKTSNPKYVPVPSLNDDVRAANLKNKAMKKARKKARQTQGKDIIKTEGDEKGDDLDTKVYPTVLIEQFGSLKVLDYFIDKMVYSFRDGLAIKYEGRAPLRKDIYHYKGKRELPDSLPTFFMYQVMVTRITGTIMSYESFYRHELVGLGLDAEEQEEFEYTRVYNERARTIHYVYFIILKSKGPVVNFACDITTYRCAINDYYDGKKFAEGSNFTYSGTIKAKMYEVAKKLNMDTSKIAGMVQEKLDTLSSTPGYDNIRDAIENRLKPLLSNKAVTQVVDLWCVIHLGYKVRDDPLALAYLFNLFLRSETAFKIPERLAYSSLFGLFMNIFTAFGNKNSLKTEGFSVSETLSDVAFYMKSLASGSIAEAIRNFFITLLSLKALPYDTAMKIRGYFGTLPSLDLYSATVMLIESIATLSKVVENLMKGAKMSDLLFSKNPNEAAILKGRELINRSECVYVGAPVPNYVDVRTYVRECDEVLSILEKILKAGNYRSPHYATATTLKNTLLPIKLRWQSDFLSNTRATPLFVVLTGKPGIGKSTILEWVQRAHAHAVRPLNKDGSVDWKPEYTFHKNAYAEHWDGYDPLSTPYVHLSELGGLAKWTVENKGDTSIQEIPSLVDSISYNVNMAHLDGKGKTKFLADMIIADVNDPNMGVDWWTSNPAAHKRRALYIEPTVKVDCRSDVGCGIDFAKANGLNLRLNDRHTFAVYQQIQHDEVTSEKKWLLQPGTSADETYDFLIEYFRAHVDKEQAIRFLKNNETKVSYGSKYPIRVVEEKQDRDPTYEESSLAGNLELTDEKSDGVTVVTESRVRSRRFFREMELWVSERLDFLSGVQSRAANLVVGCIDYVKASVSAMIIKRDIYNGRKLIIERTRNLLWIIIFISFVMALLYSLKYWPIAFVTLAILYFFEKHLLDMQMELISAEKERAALKVAFGAYSLSGYVAGNDNAISDIRRFRIFGHFMVGLGSGLAAIGLFKLCKMMFAYGRDDNKIGVSNMEPEGSVFKVPSEYNERINTIEDSVNADRSVTRIKTKLPDHWLSKQGNHPSAFCNTITELDNLVKSQTRCVTIKFGNVIINSMGLGILGDYMLINTHVLPTDKNADFELYISKNGIVEDEKATKTIITGKTRVDVGDDISVLRVTNDNYRNLNKFITDTEFGVAVGMIGGVKVNVSAKTNVEADNSRWGVVTARKAYAYDLKNHYNGLCGTPLLVETSGGAALVGFHFAGASNSGKCYSTAFDKARLNVAFKVLREKSEYAPVYSRTEDDTRYVEPHPKSPLQYLDINDVQYIGTLENSRLPTLKSRVTKTPYHDEIETIFAQIGFERTKTYAPPCMKPHMDEGVWISPYNNAIHSIARLRPAVNRVDLRVCAKYWADHVIQKLRERGQVNLNPLTMECAINGDPNDAYLKRINASTGAGYGYKGKKDCHIPIVSEEDGNVVREPVEVLKKRLVERMEKYRNEELSGMVFEAKLKDEPRPIEKVKNGKTRMFYPANIEALILSRMFLGPLFTLMAENRDLFFCAIGIDMHKEGDAFIKRYRNFDRENGEVNRECVEWDYKEFDISMLYELIQAAHEFLDMIAMAFGYNEEAMKMMNGVLCEGLFPTININGDMLKKVIQASGKYGTLEINCIVNILIQLMYFYKHPKLGLAKFFTDYEKDVLGDDSLGKPSRAIREYFDAVQFARFCEATFGIGVSSADKSSEIKPFKDIDDVTFLKRSFRYREDLNMYVAQLEKDSILRMCMWYIPSSISSPIDQLIGAVNASLWETYMYLERDVWEEHRSRMVAVFVKHFPAATSLNFVSYKDIHYRLCPTAIALRGEEEHERKEDLRSVGWIKTEGKALSRDQRLVALARANHRNDSTFGRVLSLNQWPMENTQINLSKQIASFETELKDVEQQLEPYLPRFQGLDPHDIMRGNMYASMDSYRKAADEYIALFSQKEALELSIRILERYASKLRNELVLRTESDEISVQKIGEVDAGKIDLHQNLEEVEGESHDTMKLHTGEHKTHVDRGLSLDKFFERPVQIAAVALTLNTDIDLTYNIWDLYLANPAVRAKLRNYAFVRMDLGVKIIISGTPFHYGRMLVSYQPYTAVNTNLSFGPSFRSAKLRYYSQAIGAVTMDVRDNKPVDMHIPYISPMPISRLYNDTANAQSATTAFGDFSPMGNLYISSLNRIGAVSSTPTNVFMYVYVYATNVSVMGATGSVSTITTESDERQKGPVERLTSAALPLSRALETIPSIGLYAKASSIALGVLNKMSALFGWSYPTLIALPQRMRPEPWMNGAQVIGTDTGRRITLDPKQEVTVDPRVVGISEDELALATICKKEGLLDTFTWLNGSVPLSTINWRAAVTPRAAVCNVRLTQYACVPTPLGFAATPFQYWRGTIKYRFEIVCSNFHRGKLMFYYEPNVRQYSLITAALNTNKQYVKIIDIQETQHVEFCIDWNFPRMWAENLPDAGVPLSIGSSFVQDSYKWDCANGMIFVTPFTALQSPDGSGVSINVYVSSDDMSFNRFTEKNYPRDIRPYTESNERYITESAESLGKTTEENYSCMDLAPPVLTSDNISHLHFGEQPVSFRSLLKRFQQGTSIVTAASAVATLRAYVMKVFPDNSWTSTVDRGANFGTKKPKTLYNYLRYAYLAQRGALRHRIRFVRGTATVGDFRYTVSLTPDSSVTGAITPLVGGELGGTSTVDADGSIQLLSTVNNGIEYEVPFYSNNLFVWACNDDPFFATNISAFQVDNSRNYNIWVEGLETSICRLNENFATGEDFTFMRWLGAPPVFLDTVVV